MTIQSAKRYGLDIKDDPEQESRLRRIEGELERKKSSNLDGSQTSRANNNLVPQVSGLRVIGSTAGTVTVAWNPVVISDLRRYELRFSQSFSFSSSQLLKLSTTRYQLTTVSASGGAGNTPLFVQVRAVNVAGVTGAWSVVLNAVTGQLQTEDIEDGAVDEYVLADDSIGLLTASQAIASLALYEGLKGPISGLTVTRDSSQTMSVAPGSTMGYKQWLTSPLTKNSQSVWAAGNNMGGMSPTVPSIAFENYFFFLILNSITGAVDAGFDYNINAVNLLSVSGYDKYRIVGAVRTTTSGINDNCNLQHHELFREKSTLTSAVIRKWENGDPVGFFSNAPYKPDRATRRSFIVKSSDPTFNALNPDVTFAPYPKTRVQVIMNATANFDQTDEGNERNACLYISDLKQAEEIPNAGDENDAGNALGQAGGGSVGVVSMFTQVQAEVRVMTSEDQFFGMQTVDYVNDNCDGFVVTTAGFNWLGLRGAVTSDTN